MVSVGVQVGVSAAHSPKVTELKEMLNEKDKYLKYAETELEGTQGLVAKQKLQIAKLTEQLDSERQRAATLTNNITELTTVEMFNVETGEVEPHTRPPALNKKVEELEGAYKVVSSMCGGCDCNTFKLNGCSL